MTAIAVTTVVPLRDAVDVALAGAKAATLAVLAAEGFAVPPGVVVTTRAFEDAVAAGGPLRVPEDVLAALTEAVGSWGHVAVRSSAVAEDLADASYAGLYTSVLDVPAEPAALAVAVERCWESACSDLVAGYAGPRRSPGMAVLVQPMVAATAAGIAFTADPVTGERDVVVVDAVPGVAARLAGGEETPDRWVVREDGAERAAGARGPAALDPGSALAVAHLARSVAVHRRAPQDIEWALDRGAGGEPVLLQARPITALPVPAVPVAVEVPPGYWTRESTHARRPWTRLTHDLFRVRAPALREAVAELGLLFDGLDVAEIGGLEYTRIVPLGDREPPRLPDWLVPLAFRLVPALRRRIRVCVEAMRDDVPMAVLRRWAAEWRPDLEARTDALRGVGLGDLTDAELDAHLGAVVDLAEEGLAIHFRLHAVIAMVLGEFARCCRDLLGWDEAGWQRLVAGTSVRSTEPARLLAELATHADEPDFPDRFAEHLRRHCVRALSYELAEESLDEQPELVLSLMRDQQATGFDPAARDRALAEERDRAATEARAQLSDVDRARFDAVLARALVAYPVREDNNFVTTAAPCALVRKAVVECGRRLVARGQLPVPDTAFHLRPAELRAALCVGDDLTAVVTRRAGERAWAMANPGPAHHGTPPPPPPPMTSLPPEARRANESFLWAVEQIFGPDTAGPTGDDRVLSGIAASPGTYRGTVRIVRDETEFDRVRPGDVVVCPTTSPVWSLLFPIIGALVTDEGGPLSHPAIIAREHGVPAVVATVVATGTLGDGQRVAVDGGAGTVTVLA